MYEIQLIYNKILGQYNRLRYYNVIYAYQATTICLVIHYHTKTNDLLQMSDEIEENSIKDVTTELQIMKVSVLSY